MTVLFFKLLELLLRRTLASLSWVSVAFAVGTSIIALYVALQMTWTIQNGRQ